MQIPMTLVDCQGLEVSTKSQKCVQLLNEFVIAVLSYSQNSKKIVKQALQEDNYCSLANLYLAHLYEQQLTF
jgi:hypothetical protein